MKIQLGRCRTNRTCLSSHDYSSLPKLFGASVWACQQQIEQQITAAGLDPNVVARPVWRNVFDRISLRRRLTWPLLRVLEHETDEAA
ncbi:hypothetical protein LCGC14_0823520 [marine sediment metagenome]|uniref:Uncharacterized protein n=1 Tax=marine sediment metagenome TaxID=412755 RepID=A0A0F9PMR1_9ZZZZ